MLYTIQFTFFFLKRIKKNRKKSISSQAMLGIGSIRSKINFFRLEKMQARNLHLLLKRNFLIQIIISLAVNIRKS
jgi:prolipoprotein diacylglyceryltransferase